MLDAWKKQFTVAQFALEHEDSSVFAMSQWQRKPVPSVGYLVYRMAMTAFLLSSLVLSMVDERNFDKPYMFRLKWPIYLTNWGFLVCTVQAVLATAILIRDFLSSRKGDDEAACGEPLYKVFWATNIIATDASFAITALYWAIIYDASTMPLDYLNILVHGMNSVAMFIELCVVAHPVKLAHIYFPFLFGLVYTTFTVIYYAAGGTSRDGKPNIYKVINWDKPGPTIAICVGAMVFLVVIHCCSFLVYKLRKWLATKLLKREVDCTKAQIPIQEIFRGFDNEAMTHEII
ncbi:PREDICTED: protein rolling stone-like isoform X2 [Nicrophorus vespilloides]|nr:PREDICTED: protein rolling stone-like isoform X2 [Nicrophorus vespilloides]XP_017780246.1 PREDICTED: protein rolling stone-like isoform X2 [Nicrophorus vespilloides]